MSFELRVFCDDKPLFHHEAFVSGSTYADLRNVLVNDGYVEDEFEFVRSTSIGLVGIPRKQESGKLPVSGDSISTVHVRMKRVVAAQLPPPVAVPIQPQPPVQPQPIINFAPTINATGGSGGSVSNAGNSSSSATGGGVTTAPSATRQNRPIGMRVLNSATDSTTDEAKSGASLGETMKQAKQQRMKRHENVEDLLKTKAIEPGSSVDKFAPGITPLGKSKTRTLFVKYDPRKPVGEVFWGRMLRHAYKLLDDGEKAAEVINKGIFYAQQNAAEEITPEERAWTEKLLNSTYMVDNYGVTLDQFYDQETPATTSTTTATTTTTTTKATATTSSSTTTGATSVTPARLTTTTATTTTTTLSRPTDVIVLEDVDIAEQQRFLDSITKTSAPTPIPPRAAVATKTATAKKKLGKRAQRGRVLTDADDDDEYKDDDNGDDADNDSAKRRKTELTVSLPVSQANVQPQQLEQQQPSVPTVPEGFVISRYNEKNPVRIAVSQAAVVQHLTAADWKAEYEGAQAVLAHLLPRQEGDPSTHIRFAFVNDDHRNDAEKMLPYDANHVKLLGFTPKGFQSQPPPGRLVWARCHLKARGDPLSDVLYEAMVMKRGSAGSVKVYFKCDDVEQTIPNGSYVNILETGDPRIQWALPSKPEVE